MSDFADIAKNLKNCGVICDSHNIKAGNSSSFHGLAPREQGSQIKLAALDWVENNPQAYKRFDVAEGSLGALAVSARDVRSAGIAQTLNA